MLNRKKVVILTVIAAVMMGYGTGCANPYSGEYDEGPARVDHDPDRGEDARYVALMDGLGYMHNVDPDRIIISETKVYACDPQWDDYGDDEYGYGYTSEPDYFTTDLGTAYLYTYCIMPEDPESDEEPEGFILCSDGYFADLSEAELKRLDAEQGAPYRLQSGMVHDCELPRLLLKNGFTRDYVKKVLDEVKFTD